jgi:hypothetical protein
MLIGRFEQHIYVNIRLILYDELITSPETDFSPFSRAPVQVRRRLALLFVMRPYPLDPWLPFSPA